MRTLPFAATGLVLLVCATGRADVSDRAGARAQLQQGYALKQQGKCDQAIPYFTESLRLSREAKGLLNLADCEEKVGKLASAQAHFVEARDLAGVQGLAPQKSLAEERLQALEKRMPRLVIKLAKTATADTVVSRDGVQLGTVSLNAPLPVDPGKHTVLARGGNLERQYDVTISEAETKELEVTPEGGRAVAGAPTSGSPATGTALPGGTERVQQPPPAIESNVDVRGDGKSGLGRGTIELALLGVGIAGLAVGTVGAVTVASKNSHALDLCPDHNCPTDEAYADSQSDRDSAGTARTVSMIGFGVGAVALVTDAVLFLTDSSRSKATTGAVAIVPQLGTTTLGASIQGTWR